MDAIEKLVFCVELSLKLVSDELTHQPEETIKTTTALNDPTQTQQMLKGVIRVGLLAKGLLLKGERVVQLVALCSKPPTYQLLDRIAQALPAHLSVSI